MSRHVFPLTQQNLIAAQGLTKRELFAAMAMQGMIETVEGTDRRPWTEALASMAVEAADALIEKLEKDTDL